MFKLLCVIRDRLSDSCGPVMAFPAIPAAIRQFSDVAVDSQTMVARHPEDFDLLHIANMDERSGAVEAVTPPVVLLTGVQWLASQKPSGQTDPQLSLLSKEA